MGRLERIEAIEEWVNDQYYDLRREASSLEERLDDIRSSEEFQTPLAEYAVSGRVWSTDLLDGAVSAVKALRSETRELKRRWESVSDTAERRLPNGWEDYISLGELRRPCPFADETAELTSIVAALRGGSVCTDLGPEYLDDDSVEAAAEAIYEEDAEWFVAQWRAREGAPNGELPRPPLPVSVVESKLLELYKQVAVAYALEGDSALDGRSVTSLDEMSGWGDDVVEWLDEVAPLLEPADLSRAARKLAAGLKRRSSAAEVVEGIEGWLGEVPALVTLIDAWRTEPCDAEERWRRDWLHRQWKRRGQSPPDSVLDVPPSPAAQAEQLRALRQAQEEADRLKREAAEAQRDRRKRALSAIEEVAALLSTFAPELSVAVDRRALCVTASGEFDAVVVRFTKDGDIQYSTAKTALSGELPLSDVQDGVLTPLLQSL